MIHVPITSSMKGKATRSANRMGRLRNSITRGKGNVYGFLGEQIAQLVLGGELVNKGKKHDVNYDLVLDDGATIEVKTADAIDDDDFGFSETFEFFDSPKTYDPVTMTDT